MAVGVEQQRPKMSPQEERLRRMVIAFTAAEARKEIKWEVNLGKAVPTAECVQNALQAEVLREEAERRRQTSEDYYRQAVVLDADTVVVEAEDVPVGGAPDQSFASSPTDDLQAKRRLLNSIVEASRMVLQRNRVESRIRRVVAARSGTASRRVTTFFSEHTEPSFLDVPVSTVTVVQPRPGLPAMTVDSDLTFEDPLPLYSPFQYQVKEYTQHPLLEHPFVSAEQASEIELGKAGESREPEVATAPVSWEPEHFVPPPAGESHYPTAAHPFTLQAPMTFYSYAIPQEVWGGDEPYRVHKYAQDVKPALLPSSPLVMDVLRAPLPALLPKALDEDRMSDTEDEDAEVPGWERPHGLASIARLPWLTGLEGLISDGSSNGAAGGATDGGGDGAFAVVAPTSLPIHTHDRETLNEGAAAKLDEFDALSDALLSRLPQRLRKIV